MLLFDLNWLKQVLHGGSTICKQLPGYSTLTENISPLDSPRKTVMGESSWSLLCLRLFLCCHSNLLSFWQTIQEACPCLAAHLVAGGKQLDTAISRPADDIKACGSEWYDPASADGLCESISKIIHSAVATHFCLPASIRVLRGEDDRRGARGAVGRFCLICHQRPGDPP